MLCTLHVRAVTCFFVPVHPLHTTRDSVTHDTNDAPSESSVALAGLLCGTHASGRQVPELLVLSVGLWFLCVGRGLQGFCPRAFSCGEGRGVMYACCVRPRSTTPCYELDATQCNHCLTYLGGFWRTGRLLQVAARQWACSTCLQHSHQSACSSSKQDEGKQTRKGQPDGQY